MDEEVLRYVMEEDYTACGHSIGLLSSLTVYCDKEIREDGKHLDGNELHHVELLMEEGTGKIAQA